MIRMKGSTLVCPYTVGRALINFIRQVLLGGVALHSAQMNTILPVSKGVSNTNFLLMHNFISHLVILKAVITLVLPDHCCF